MLRIVSIVGRLIRVVGWAVLVIALPVGVLGAWGNSYVLGDWVHYYDDRRPMFVWASSSGGRIRVAWRRSMALYPPGWDSSFRSQRYSGGTEVPGAVLGFGFAWKRGMGSVQVPYWFVSAISLVAPGVALRRRAVAHRAARWVAEGRCSRCGYDLRASSGRCPECGAARRAGAVRE